MTVLGPLVLAAASVSCSAEVRPTYAVAPEYTDAVQLADAQVSGVVTVRTTVSRGGAVTEAVAQGSPFLMEASLAAARQWRFSVPKEASVPCEVVLKFSYELVPPDAPSAELGTRYAYPWLIEVRGRRPRAERISGLLRFDSHGHGAAEQRDAPDEFRDG